MLVLDGGVVTGPAGASVIVTPIAIGTAPCTTGRVRITQLSDGGTTSLCNGAVGPVGLQGVAESSGNKRPGRRVDGGTLPVCNGSQGPQGLVGPAGPTGSQGFTSGTSTGALGGAVGANQKCNAEFPGASFCTLADFDLANQYTLPPPATGAWVDSARTPAGARNSGSCYASGAWTNGTSDTGTNLNATGSFNGQVSCTLLKPVACCHAR